MMVQFPGMTIEQVCNQGPYLLEMLASVLIWLTAAVAATTVLIAFLIAIAGRVRTDD